jgi:hypothetical protein
MKEILFLTNNKIPNAGVNIPICIENYFRIKSSERNILEPLTSGRCRPRKGWIVLPGEVQLSALGFPAAGQLLTWQLLLPLLGQVGQGHRVPLPGEGGGSAHFRYTEEALFIHSISYLICLKCMDSLFGHPPHEM